MHKRVKLIFNPYSDRGRSGQKASDLQAIVDTHGGADWIGTEYPTHATKLAEAAGHERYDIVVALGGDGTVHEVVNGLMRVPSEHRPKLGVVPIGSGNDFAFCSGINMDPGAAMLDVFTGSPAPVDIGLISDNTGRQTYFDNSAGMLIDAAVNIQSRKITRVYGFLMYLTAAVRAIIENFTPTHIEFNIDGAKSEQKLIMFTVANGAREGGGFLVAPEARNDDGRFDYLMVTPISRLTMFSVLPQIMKGKHTRHSYVKIAPFNTMELKADRAIPIHLDGELWAPYEANIRALKIDMLPGAIQLMRNPQALKTKA